MFHNIKKCILFGYLTLLRYLLKVFVQAFIIFFTTPFIIILTLQSGKWCGWWLENRKFQPLVGVTHIAAGLSLARYKLVCPNGNWVIGGVFSIINAGGALTSGFKETLARCVFSLLRCVFYIFYCALYGSIQRQINKTGSSESERSAVACSVIWAVAKYAAEWVTENRSLIMQTPVSQPFVSADDQPVMRFLFFVYSLWRRR